MHMHAHECAGHDLHDLHHDLHHDLRHDRLSTLYTVTQKRNGYLAEYPKKSLSCLRSWRRA